MHAALLSPRGVWRCPHIREAAAGARLDGNAGSGDTVEIRFGEELHTRILASDDNGELRAEQVAAYVAEYSCKSSHEQITTRDTDTDRWRARQDQLPDNADVNDDGSTVVLSVWQYIGSGYLNPGDVLLSSWRRSLPTSCARSAARSAPRASLTSARRSLDLRPSRRRLRPRLEHCLNLPCLLGGQD